MRFLPSEEEYLGKFQEPIVCPNCGKQTGIRASEKAYEGDWVNRCWTCDFMWSHEDDEKVREVEAQGKEPRKP